MFYRSNTIIYSYSR